MNGEENTAALNLSPNRTSEKDDIGQHIQRKASKLENLVSSFLKVLITLYSSSRNLTIN